MVSESDKCILSKDVSSVASMADALFPEKAKMPKVDSIGPVKPYIGI